MYINQFDTNAECATRGKSAEDLFEFFLQQTGKKYRPATLIEQYNHIDFVVSVGKDLSIDVKGPKKITRTDSNTGDEYIWVEFVNVRGDKGWLYGKNDLLAFYRTSDSSFYVVRTEDLAKLCEKLCDNKKVFSPQNALYHRYTRAGRKDVIAMIKYEDLSKIHCIRASMKKYEEMLNVT